MTVPLSPESPRRAAARRFGIELRRAMARRRVGTKRLAPAAGVATSAVAAWRAGANLPRLETALRVAEALEAPLLATIVREARQGRCAACGRPFLNEGGRPKRYCSAACQPVISAAAVKPPGLYETAVETLRAEMLRVGPVRRQAVGKALTLLSDARSRHPAAAAAGRLPLLESAINAMCSSCEPAGYCRTEDCPLRPVSPLRLLVAAKEAELATPAPGRWARPEEREAQSALLRTRWADPGARRRQGEKATAWHASLSEEERAAWRAKIATPRRQRGADA